MASVDLSRRHMTHLSMYRAPSNSMHIFFLLDTAFKSHILWKLSFPVVNIYVPLESLYIYNVSSMLLVAARASYYIFVVFKAHFDFGPRKKYLMNGVQKKLPTATVLVLKIAHSPVEKTFRSQ